MALITCPECGKEVSNTAGACPHCGYALKTHSVEVKKKMGCFSRIFIVLLGLFVFFLVKQGFEDKEPEIYIIDPAAEESVNIPTGCQKHIEIHDANFWAKELDKTPGWVQSNHKINLWQYGSNSDRGEIVGEISPGSRAIVIEKKGNFYRIRSPHDQSIGWINKIQVQKTLFVNTKTFKRCKP